MKHWQIIVIVLLLATAGWAIISYPPGTRTVSQVRTEQPDPIPTPEPKQQPITLLFVGDIMLSRSVGDAMAARKDWTWPFALIASATRDADLAFANLETTISTRGTVNGCGYCFRSDPRVVEGLTFAGFDVLSVANNHTWDYGLTALEDTLGILADNNMNTVGAGLTLTEARGPLIKTIGATRIAYLAYTDILPASAQATEARAGVNLYNADRMAADIERARSLADVVVVSFHTGTEYEPFHNPVQERIYRSAIDSGADLVVGHHPHVVQDVERYKGKWIAYSLGNFVFDQNFSEATRRGGMLRVTVEDGAISVVATASVDISKQYQVSHSR